MLVYHESWRDCRSSVSWRSEGRPCGSDAAAVGGNIDLGRFLFWFCLRRLTPAPGEGPLLMSSIPGGRFHLKCNIFFRDHCSFGVLTSTEAWLEGFFFSLPKSFYLRSSDFDITFAGRVFLPKSLYLRSSDFDTKLRWGRVEIYESVLVILTSSDLVWRDE